MNTDACCAHCKVVLKHIDHPGGTRSDYWECADGCGCKFWPESHTAKAVEEATSSLSNRLIGKSKALEAASRTLDELVKPTTLSKEQREELTSYATEYFGRGVKGVWHEFSKAIVAMLAENATLQKQCESLQEDANRDALQYEGKCTEILVLQDQCDDLRTRADEQRIKIMELDRALDTMHQRAEKAEAAHDELQKHVLFLNELKTKAEAEVAELRAQWLLVKSELTVLQQDVRPLVEYIALQEWPTARKTLEAFLAKHPELK